jgi:flagellar protein FlgJ
MKINPINAMQNINNACMNVSRSKTDTFQKALETAQESKDEKKLLSACQDFETVFIHMMLKNMRNTIPKDGLIPKSFSQEVFEDMLDEHLSKKIAKHQGLGLAKDMYDQLSKNLKSKPIDVENDL